MPSTTPASPASQTSGLHGTRSRWRGLVAAGSAFALLAGAAFTAPQGTQSAQAALPQTNASAPGDAIKWWLTTGDSAQKLAPQADLAFTSEPGEGTATINIDPSRTYQTMAGFGASFTDSSSYNITNELPTTVREELMQDLFSPATGIGLSWLRQPLGASDYVVTDPHSTGGPFYTYQTNYNSAVDISRDQRSINLVKRALEINPKLTLMGTPWSPPAWMRSNAGVLGTTGGSLMNTYEDDFADYLAEVSKQYQTAGVPFDFISLQNEPNYAPGYIGLKMDADQQLRVIKHLATKLPAKAPHTKILGWDHNYQEGEATPWTEDSWTEPKSLNPAYPAQVLQGVAEDPAANKLVAGVAMHCYLGLPEWAGATTLLHNRFPTKDVYFTECSGTESSTPAATFRDSLAYHAINYAFPALRNYSKSLSFWNLALDQSNGPYPSGYGICSNCSATVTVNSDGTFTKNINYYLLGHFSKFVVPGAMRIGSDEPSPSTDANNIAFKNPNGTYALALYNPDEAVRTTTVNVGEVSFTAPIPAMSMATFTWGDPDPVPVDPVDPVDPTHPPTTQKTVTTLTANRSAQVYGTTSPAVITANVRGATTSPRGSITFNVNSKTMKTVKVTAGSANTSTAKYTLPWSLTPGTHQVTATFRSSEVTSAGSASSAIKIKVAAAKTSTAAKLVKPKIKRTSKAQVRVTVKVEKQSSAKVRPAGTLKIISGKKVIKQVKIAASRKGKVTISLPRLKNGKHSLRVTFTPAKTTVKPSKTKILKLTVR